jgi:hypothetical protein
MGPKLLAKQQQQQLLVLQLVRQLQVAAQKVPWQQ